MFTQGKWVARIDEYAVDVVEEKSGFGICDIGTRKQLRNANYPNEQADANAKLIAAAPDLLEALQAILPEINHVWELEPKNSNAYRWSQQIKAAIAKAVG